MISEIGQDTEQMRAAVLESLLENASQDWNEGRFKRALASYQEIAVTHSDAVDAWKTLAAKLAELGRQSEAETVVQKLPVNLQTAARKALGGAFSRADKFLEAIEQYRKVVSADPGDSEAYAGWAWALVRQSTPDAEQAFEAAISSAPTGIQAMARRALGDAFSYSEKFREAIEQFRKAVSADPSDSDAYAGWADALGLLSALDPDAEQAFEAALNNAPAGIQAKARVALGDAYSNRKKLQEAIEQYRKAVSADPNNSGAYAGWAYALGHLSEPDLDAMHDFDEVLNSAPADIQAKARKVLGDAFSKSEKFWEAIEQYRKAVSADPNNSGAYAGWADALGRLSTPDPVAEQAFEAAMNSASAGIQAMARKALGDAFSNSDTFWVAIEQYRKAVSADPNNSGAYAGWAYALGHLSEPDLDAMHDFDEALNSAPADIQAKARKVLGDAFSNSEKFREAIEQYRKAVSADPSDSVAYENWASALAQISPPDPLAERTFEVALNASSPQIQVMAYTVLGNKCNEDSMFAEAIEYFRKAVDVKEAVNLTGAHRGWGEALLGLDNPALAIAHFRQSTAGDKQYKYSYAGWARALVRLPQDQADALRVFESQVRETPLAVQADAYNALGLAFYYEAGQYKEAEEQFRLALAAGQFKEANAHNGLGWVSIKLGSPQSAIEHFQKAWAPGNFNTLSGWARALAQASSPDAHALSAFDAALKDQDPAVQATVYTEAGNQLLEDDKASLALEKYGLAAEASPGYLWAYFGWALALEKERRYEEALAKYQELIDCGNNPQVATSDDKERALAFAFHNRASILWKLGHYTEARRQWEEAGDAYRLACKNNHPKKDAYFYYAYGAALQEGLNDLEAAESVLRDGLRLDSRDPLVLTRLISILLRKKEIFADRDFRCIRHDDDLADTRTKAHWEAQQLYEKATKLLHLRVQNAAERRDSLHLLADLQLEMSDQEAAEKTVRALEQQADPGSRGTLAQRGALLIHQEKYDEAIRTFEDAVRLDPDDFNIQASLAGAYRRTKRFDKAEAIFQRTLAVASYHVESQLGLGEVFLDMADAGDADLYEQAITFLSTGITMLEQGTGSKHPNKRDLAKALYLRGYAKVKLYEAPKTRTDWALCYGAEADFRRCYCKCDPDFHKARRAEEKLKQRHGLLRPRGLLEGGGPLLIFASSAVVFVLAQLGYWFPNYSLANSAIAGKIDMYSLLTFGSLLFMVAGLYLPQLLKLKVGGIELEKSSLDQSTPAGPIGIRR